MANEEVLGPRKTMFVLVIVVGCFAVLWPRILAPLILGNTRDQLKANEFDREAAMKQERPSIRPGQHPALRERGRAIPPGAAPSPSRTVAMPPHVRPPPIPGMRPPLGSPGGPVPAPKTSMGFVMPIYTICIIVFFVYTLSKILFKRTASPYEAVTTDQQFRRRVFREDSRTTPDKLGDVELEALRARLAETERAMQRIVGQLGRRDADAQDNTRSYTNGTILHNTGPVHIVASEYREASIEKSPEPRKDFSRQTKETLSEQDELEHEIENTIDPTEDMREEGINANDEELDDGSALRKLISESQQFDSPSNNIHEEIKDTDLEINESQPEENSSSEVNEHEELRDTSQLLPSNELDGETEENENVLDNTEDHLIKPAESSEDESDVAKLTEYFIEEARRTSNDNQDNLTAHEILRDAIKEDSPKLDHDEEQENASVKVMGMEVTAHSADGGAWVRPEPPLPPPHQPQQQRPHEAEEVKSIFLETEIPQKSRVLVTDFVENRPDAPKPADSSPMVVSGKMTLSLIQDATRDTPERDPESTIEDFTTASAITQPPNDKEANEESDEEIEEEIEIEEIEEEVEDEEDEEIEPVKVETIKPSANGTH